MKKSTEERLLEDAIIAATAWQMDASEWKAKAEQARKQLAPAFILGLLVALLGIVIFTSYV